MFQKGWPGFLIFVFIITMMNGQLVAGETYPEKLTEEIVSRLSEVAKDTFASLVLTHSQVERAEAVREAVLAEYALHSDRVLGIPGASKFSREHLDWFLRNYANIFFKRALEVGAGEQVPDTYFLDPYGPSKIHRFFDLRYLFPV